MSGEVHGQLRDQGVVRVVHESEHGKSEMQYFSMSPELPLILACLSRTFIK
jgi:hypothetical protein